MHINIKRCFCCNNNTLKETFMGYTKNKGVLMDYECFYCNYFFMTIKYSKGKMIKTRRLET